VQILLFVGIFTLAFAITIIAGLICGIESKNKLEKDELRHNLIYINIRRAKNLDD
jgi:hypothetical protein